MGNAEVNYRSVANEIYYRMETAAGETAYEISQHPHYAEDYGKKVQDCVKACKKRGYDIQGSVGDVLFNDDGFWDMAQDWLGDELQRAGAQMFPYNSPGRKEHWNKACDALAGMASFKSKLILSWKEK